MAETRRPNSCCVQIRPLLVGLFICPAGFSQRRFCLSLILRLTCPKRVMHACLRSFAGREKLPEEAKDSIASAGRPLIPPSGPFIRGVLYFNLHKAWQRYTHTRARAHAHTYRHRFIFVHLIVLFGRRHDTSHRLIDDAFAADIDARKTFVMGADPSLTRRRVTNQLAPASLARGRALINTHAVC